MTTFRRNAGELGSSDTQYAVEVAEQQEVVSASTEKRKEAVHLYSVFKGFTLSFLSGMCYALCGVIVKSMKNIHPGQLTVYRFIGIFFFSLPQAVKTQENLLGQRELRFLLVLRGIFGATCTFLHFVAFRYLSLGEAAVIILSVPVFVTVAARIFLKESCGIVQSIAVVGTVIGVSFIVGVPEISSEKSVNYTEERIYGLVASFASMIFGAAQDIVLRKLKSVHHSVIMLNLGWTAVLETSLLTALFGNFTLLGCGLQQGLLILLCIISYAGVTLLTMALQVEQAGPVSTVRAASDIILSFLCQTFIFRNYPDAFSIAGAVLVGISIVLVGLIKWVQSLPSESSTAKNLMFLRA